MKLMLVGLDGSDRAEGVRAAAVDLARQTGARMILVRAVGVPHEIPVDAYTMSPAGLVEILDKTARDYLDEVARRCPTELVADRVSQIGVPWQSLCATADRLGVDLIVIGSHGYSAIDRLLGTTAAKVVNHANQSVLVVRPRPPT